MAVVGDVVVGDGHLSAAYACADVAHAVVVAYCFVLVVGVALACLGGVPEDFAGGFGVTANQCASSRSGYHFVAVEAQHAVPAESAERLPVEAAAEAFGGILDDRNFIFVGHGHDFVDFVWHAVQSHGDYRFRLASGAGDAVGDGSVEQLRIHVP